MQKKIYCEPILKQVVLKGRADVITFSLNGTTQGDPFSGNPFTGNETPSTEVEE